MDGDGITDYLSYNATTGLAIYSVATGIAGEQRIVKQVNAAKGWTSVVPMGLNNDSFTDLLSYNSATGLAIYSIATSTPGEQKIVKTVNAAKGWTSIVPMNLKNRNCPRTDLLSYNAATGLAIYSIGSSSDSDCLH
jgi:hypothetical protein